jgi:hypothetical protein
VSQGDLTMFTKGAADAIARATRRVGRHARGFGERELTGAEVVSASFEDGGHARIVSSSLVTGSHIRWAYTIRPGQYVAPETPGDPPTWEDLAPPDEEGADYWDVIGFNAAEMPNTALTGTTTIGTGNTVDADTGAVAGTPCILLPIGDDVIVWVRVVAHDADGNPCYVFDAISNSAEVPVGE